MRHITIIRRVMFDNQMDPLFWVVMGYQRALGELMIRADDPSRVRARQCIGYAEFSSRLETDSTFTRWFDGLAADISELAKRQVVRTDRLVALEGAVVDLIDFLDPHNVRYPLRRSRRVSEMSPEEAAAWYSVVGKGHDLTLLAQRGHALRMALARPMSFEASLVALSGAYGA